MQLRLHGTPAECQEAARRLAEVFAVVSVSGAYPDRGGALVRVYVEVCLQPRPNDPAAPAARPARPQRRRRVRRAPTGTGGTP